ncbi:MAG: glycosyltransferase family 2 protein [Gammaproteobacteria bacterium]
MKTKISIVLPAKNEASGLRVLLPQLTRDFKGHEIMVVNDGSTDDTIRVCEEYEVGAISHPYPMGNGAAIKTRARAATGNVLVFMDADGQHQPEDIPKLLQKLDEGFDMVVGARDGNSQASLGRWFANFGYNRFASLIVGRRIDDLTSGFRAVKASRFREFLHLLPNGFSYPTTSTMAFFRSGYPVAYVPIQTKKRSGKSHIKWARDGLRFLVIVFKVGTLYAPLKIFIPFSGLSFMAGLANYTYTYITEGRFTNMSAVLFIVAVLIFLMGLLSEQVTMLLYQRSDPK